MELFHLIVVYRSMMKDVAFLFSVGCLFMSFLSFIVNLLSFFSAVCLFSSVVFSSIFLVYSRSFIEHPDIKHVKNNVCIKLISFIYFANTVPAKGIVVMYVSVAKPTCIGACIGKMYYIILCVGGDVRACAPMFLGECTSDCAH